MLRVTSRTASCQRTAPKGWSPPRHSPQSLHLEPSPPEQPWQASISPPNNHKGSSGNSQGPSHHWHHHSPSWLCPSQELRLRSWASLLRPLQCALRNHISRLSCDPQVHRHVPALSTPHVFAHASSGCNSHPPPPPGKPPLTLKFKLMLSEETPHLSSQCPGCPHQGGPGIHHSYCVPPCCPVQQSCLWPPQRWPLGGITPIWESPVSLYAGTTILEHRKCPKNTN